MERYAHFRMPVEKKSAFFVDVAIYRFAPRLLNVGAVFSIYKGWAIGHLAARHLTHINTIAKGRPIWPTQFAICQNQNVTYGKYLAAKFLYQNKGL